MALIKTDQMKSIEKKSAQAVDIFNKTVSDLSSINQQIDIETENKQKDIERLTAEKDYLSKLKDKHTKVIDKINSLFED